MHRYDFEPRGFSWLDCEDADQSVLVFTRRGDEGDVVCAFNMTPVVRHDYRIGLPCPGRYREILNTDAADYGGSGCGNLGVLQAEPVSWKGQPASATIVLPPLAAVFFEQGPEAGAQ